jgi:hypothetical protein
MPAALTIRILDWMIVEKVFRLISEVIFFTFRLVFTRSAKQSHGLFSIAHDFPQLLHLAKFGLSGNARVRITILPARR